MKTLLLRGFGGHCEERGLRRSNLTNSYCVLRIVYEQIASQTSLAMTYLGKGLLALAFAFILSLTLVGAAQARSVPVQGSLAGSSQAGKPSVKIVRPADGQYVSNGDVTVEIATDNFPADPSNSWQLFVDDKPAVKVESGKTTATVNIPDSGPHTIKVVLADAQNPSLASAQVEVTAAPATPRETPFNLAWVAPVMAVFVVFIITLIAVSLRMTRRPA